MQVIDLDALEQRLLTLGAKERKLEETIRKLPAQSRAAALAGDFTRAERLWEIHEETRTILRDLQKEITALEVRYYRLRRQSP